MEEVTEEYRQLLLDNLAKIFSKAKVISMEMYSPMSEGIGENGYVEHIPRGDLYINIHIIKE